MVSKKPNSQKLIYSEEVNNEDYSSEFDDEFESEDNGEESQLFKAERPKIKKIKTAKNRQISNVVEKNEEQIEKQKKQRNWVINTGNMAIIASSLSIVIDVLHKLLRMVLYAYSGLIIFMYIISGILCVFALIACIKNAFKYKQISIDAYFTGIAFVMLILV